MLENIKWGFIWLTIQKEKRDEDKILKGRKEKSIIRILRKLEKGEIDDVYKLRTLHKIQFMLFYICKNTHSNRWI